MIEGKKLNLAGRVLLGLGVVLNGIDAKAEYYRIDCKSVEANSPWAAVGHVNGAVEGHDSKDGAFLQSPHNPRIDFYSKVPLSYPYDKLKIDARGPNSTTYFDIKIEGAKILESIDANLSFQILDDGQDNFSWKYFIAELYNSGDVNEPNNLIASYDIKDLAEYGQKIPLTTISNGLSYQLLIKPYNYADLDRNRCVDFGDLEIFVRNWGRDERAEPDDPNNTLGTYVGKDPNDLDAYTDINRDGVVDFKDFSLFSGEWFYNADDPNTSSRLTPKVDGIDVLDGRYLNAFRQDAVKRFYGKEMLCGKEEREAA